MSADRLVPLRVAPSVAEDVGDVGGKASLWLLLLEPMFSLMFCVVIVGEVLFIITQSIAIAFQISDVMLPIADAFVPLVHGCIEVNVELAQVC